MRLTIQHYYDFGADRALVGDDLVRADAWDALRTESDGPFALPADRAAWERAADDREEIKQRAVEINDWLAERNLDSVASYGAGGATLELWLHRLDPDRRMTLADYAPSTVARLRSLFTGVEVVQHDLLRDAALDAGIHLFHRIDTEFTNSQWKAIMQRFAHESVLFVATELIDLRRAITEWRRRRHYSGQTKAGLIRNRASMQSLWQRTHRATPLRVNDLHAWALEPKP
jgi:hypothetical protein